MSEVDINRLVEFAESILKIDNTNIIQKRNGLNNLLKKVSNCIPDVLTFIDSNTKDFTNWRYRDYYSEIYTGYGLYTKKEILRYVANHIIDINEYEKDTEDDLKIRKAKLQEYAQVVGIQPTYKRVTKYQGATGAGVHYDTIETILHPDIIYVQTGTYRKYWEYKNNQLFIFALNLYRTFGNYKFMELCNFTFLYIALKNELQQVEDEMELLGILPYSDKHENTDNANKQVESNIKEKEPESKKPNREKSHFSDIIQHENKEALLERLHSLIDVCKRGVDIAAIISKATLDKYLIRLPNEEEVCSEFKLPCTWEAIRKNLIDSEKVKSDKRYIAAQGIVIFE